MEMCPNGEGSSSGGLGQTVDQPQALCSNSNQMKGKKPARINDLDEYQDVPLKDIPGVPLGYPQLAAFGSSDDELQLFRRFKSLSTRNLLPLQTKITDLADQLKQVDTRILDLPDQLGQSGISRAKPKPHEAENDLLSDERWELMKSLRDKLSEYESALCLYAASKPPNPPPDLATLARLGDWIHNEGSISGPSDDQFLLNEYDLIASRNPSSTRPGTDSGSSSAEPNDDNQELADSTNHVPTPGQLEEGRRRATILPRLRIWWGHIKHEMRKFGGAAFIIIGISVYSLNISAALGYLILANTSGSVTSSPDNSLKACVITWASTLKVLVVYESFYGNYRKENGPMKYLLFLVSLSTGLCFAVAFALHVLGANVISGVLVALSLSVVFIRIWAD